MDKSEVITLRLTKAQKDQVIKLAKQYHLTVSDFVRRAVIDMRTPAPSNNEVIKALFDANAELARLGNLLKMGIDEGTYTDEKVESLIHENRHSQGTIKKIALELGKEGT